MMSGKMKILFTVFFFAIAQLKLFYTQANYLRYDDLANDNQIQIAQSLSCLNLSNIQKRVFLLSADAKTKKIAYYNLKQQQEKIRAIIVNHYHLIPNNNSLLISQVKSKYVHRTKTWSFYQTFAIYATNYQLIQITRRFQNLGVKQSRNLGQVDFYKQKSLLSKLFCSAKYKIISLFREHQDFQISFLKNIQYTDIKIIKNQRKQQNQFKQLDLNQTYYIKGQDISYKQCRQEDQRIRLRLVFKYHRKQNIQQFDSDF